MGVPKNYKGPTYVSRDGNIFDNPFDRDAANKKYEQQEKILKELKRQNDINEFGYSKPDESDELYAGLLLIILYPFIWLFKVLFGKKDKSKDSINSNTDSNEDKSSSHCKNKANAINRKKYILILICFIVIALIIIMVFTKKNEKSNAVSDISTTNISQSNQTLEIIDKENQEFKINGMELINTILEVFENEGVEEEYNIAKGEQSVSGIIEYNVGTHILNYKTGAVFTRIKILVSKNTHNVIAIGIGDPYDYSGYIDSMLQSNYEHIQKALLKLGYVDLWNTINTYKTQIESNNAERYDDSGINGIYATYIKGVSKNSCGIDYIVFKATKEYTKTDNNNLLEQIYSKYPELKEKEGYICSNDYGEYWLIDASGNKVYFTDLESFENARKKCETEINNVESAKDNNSINDNKNIDTTSNNNTPSNVNVSSNNDTPLNGNNLNTSNAQIKPSNNQNTTNVNNNSNNNKNAEVQESKQFTANIDIGEYKTFIYNGIYTGVKYSKWSAENINYYCYLTKPSNVVYSDNTGRGVKYYINNKYVGDSTSLAKYTFNKNETITVKVIAPYIYSIDNEFIGSDIVLTEKQLNTNDLYNSPYFDKSNNTLSLGNLI